MKRLQNLIWGVVAVSFLLACNIGHQASDADTLYDGFVSPSAEYRPFVRWWWNGNSVTKDEIKRQLDVLSAAGIGGVEINPIAIPTEIDDAGVTPIQWLSEDWNHLAAYAAQETKKRGMIADLLVGSGWPFGGEFLKEDELVKRVIVHRLPCVGGHVLDESEASLIDKATQSEHQWHDEPAVRNELLFLTLVPTDPTDVSEIRNLEDHLTPAGHIKFTVPTGNHQLVYGVLQHGHRTVMHGSPGASGPVMDHFKREVTLNYLNRLLKISEDTGIPLDELFRALFCDSIELAGANWSSGFEELFYQQFGYRLEPYFPFVFYEPSVGYVESQGTRDVAFAQEIRRVRHDYNAFLVGQFLENFTKVFQEFCQQHNLKCRYQAYGNPFLMGIMEGNMIPDIPEGNNWISSTNRADEWKWNQEHGFMVWNLFAASGGRLAGRREISCEAMTCTRDIFKTSLEQIKRNDDMNFITGINQTVLHGYNYSPKEAGFPGWIQYGAYFSEQNSWWPHFAKWTDYNARLSYVFRNSDPVKKIAILGPTGDVWSEKGLYRTAFHVTPWYGYRLWESFSQAGSSSDYINESIIQDGVKRGGKLVYGPMGYEAIVLCGVTAIQPETASALKDFVSSGGRVVFVDELPSKSLSKAESERNDERVQKTMEELVRAYPDHAKRVDAPPSEDRLLPWTLDLLELATIGSDVVFDQPDKSLYQIRMVDGDRDIYFLVNSHRTKSIDLNAVFPTSDKVPWIWSPEDGSRSCLGSDAGNGRLDITLLPLQSLLLVFEPDSKCDTSVEKPVGPGEVVQQISGPWQLAFEYSTGDAFNRSFDDLVDLSGVSDQQVAEFGGSIVYTGDFESDGTGRWIRLDEANRGISEVYLNDQYLGTNWYGAALFPLQGHALKVGANQLRIKHIPVLHNHVVSLRDNPTARKWTEGSKSIPMGLQGGVWVLK